MALPRLLTHDATYLVLRKLEQDVPKFRRYLETASGIVCSGAARRSASRRYLARIPGPKMMDGGQMDLAAEIPGRTRTDPSNAFAYADDPAGARCPLGPTVDVPTRATRLVRRQDDESAQVDSTRNPVWRISSVRQTGWGKPRHTLLAFNSGFDQFEFVQQHGSTSATISSRAMTPIQLPAVGKAGE